MPATPKLGQETLEPREENLIERIVALQRQLHDKSGSKVRRAQHPKHHGLARGELVVKADLAAEFRHGIFAENRRYPVWLRYSNGRGDDDSQPTLHGLAMKLTGLEQGTDQDFLMVDHPVFFIRNLEEYVALFEAQVAAGGGSPRTFFFPGINPFRWRLASFFRIRAVRKKTGSLLATRFFSATPYRLGPHAIKFSLVPDAANGSNPPPGEDADFLGRRLAEHLRDKPASFQFRVQRQIDAVTMPVEDPTVNWDHASPASTWQTVATVQLSPQVTNSPERLTLAENMAYSPWHTLDDHRPLGGINRARRVVYEALSKDRFTDNGLPGPTSPSVG
jgi:hypothetical protein